MTDIGRSFLITVTWSQCGSLLIGMLLFKIFGNNVVAVRNDRNKKKKPKLENPSSNIEEVTEDEQSVLQEILEAHRVTFPQIEEAVLSPMSCHDTRGDIENDEASKENSVSGFCQNKIWQNHSVMIEFQSSLLENEYQSITLLSSQKLQDSEMNVNFCSRIKRRKSPCCGIKWQNFHQKES